MLIDWLFILAGFVLLYLGAEGLIRGSVRLSLRLGIAPLIIGLTVVAFGTSAPELFVSLKANLRGSGDIAVGNIVGSNIFNLAVILGIAALLQPISVKSQLISQDIPVMIGATVLFGVMAHNLTLGHLEGVILFTLLIAYILINIHQARKGRIEEQELTEEIEHHLPATRGRMGLDFVWIAVGIGLLVLGSNLLVTGAVKLAEAAGVSQAIIGLTLIAAGTGLPELATTIVAAMKKETDLAVGNVVGSNIFNLLCIGGISPMVKTLQAREVEATDFYVMIALTVILLPLSRTGMRLGRREGILLLASYAAYLYFIWPVPV